MMLDKRLIRLVDNSMKYVLANVGVQWLALAANILFMYTIAIVLHSLYAGIYNSYVMVLLCAIGVGTIIMRYIATRLSAHFSYLSSCTVKKVLREKIYEKLLRLGHGYRKKVNTAELVQTSVEGVDQLETYFGSYMPQFFYAMLAPLTLFIVMLFVSVKAAIVLFICVPLIPISIVLVQRWAKKLLSKYWGQYTEMGDTFLENLQGLTTLKIYLADGHQNEVMNQQAEQFRKITMRVLIMQLNSISIMDLVAYAGAALGMIIGIVQLKNGTIPLYGAVFIMLLSADFFLPMRQLGSFFHIAMNGMAASDKIFKFLELEEDKEGEYKDIPHYDISFKDVFYQYDEEREILKDINLDIQENQFVGIVGDSGSGKSTLAKIIAGINKEYTGSIQLGNIELKDIEGSALNQVITYVSDHSYLFKGSIKENLLMANKEASEDDMWDVLDQVNLSDFLQTQDGLETIILESASNLSGGQRQRLALARAILHDTPILIFDEATSNIDVESENDIMKNIHSLKNKKTIILISHRLANVIDTDHIYVLFDGEVIEEGTHEELVMRNGHYALLYRKQSELENYGKVVQHEA